MNMILITYELNNKTQDYSLLFDKIKSLGSSWWHYLGPTWIIKTSKSANEVSSSLLSYIDKSQDYLLVIEIDSINKQGWLPQKAWDWLNNAR
jgi:hypothetical protein